ncbi:MAG: hypothetical protein IJJ24_09580 [Solobacterium sp.]|nr:hypothetical protein [Solobacterium sp.]
MTRLILDPSFTELFPDARLAVLSVRGIRKSAQLQEAAAEELAALLREANEAAGKYLISDTISENPVPAAWRQAYRKFNAKKGARCSIENLLKRVLHNHPVGSIAPTVDITNAVSLKYAFPVGTENLDAFVGDLHLGIMKGGESFLPIGADKEDPALPGELAYYDEAGVVCRCFNWRDGQRTMVTDDTTAEFIVMECIEPDRVHELELALEELAELMQKYTGAEIIAKTIVSKDNPETEL